ncbi:unnamed protein product [Didymodactylos carnosus]|uniref:Angiotensin-converting enzyme n=1 Tax=Didymodactylos carnosus TaxID=1234261 RepID=A0A815GMU8_9BILA|nr:unnamed protein product [Didymodactylos carnosus]CAF1340664.1 unnamed protein product [Didymodactylos carnosus]CAF3639899.1 unnamed protein product [Didymodactylos carnosus]CAF4201315.1 unnamed protein product [Didymodactylos carnosus]
MIKYFAVTVVLQLLLRYETDSIVVQKQINGILNEGKVVVFSNDIDVEKQNLEIQYDITQAPNITDYSSERQAIQWLTWYISIAQKAIKISTVLNFNYMTNITRENLQKYVAQKEFMSPFNRQTLPIMKRFNHFMQYSTNYDLKRIYSRGAHGTITVDDQYIEKTSKLRSQMLNIYSTTTVCDRLKCYPLTPDLDEMMHVEKDYDRLLWAWKGWHDRCGNKVRPLYVDYIDLLTKNIQENGYTDLTEKWMEPWETDNFEDMLDQLLDDVMPLYKQLHAYVRGRLCELYPYRFNCNGPIPAHILGNMWSQQWHERLDDFLPYSKTRLADMTKILQRKNVTIHQMYLFAENFYTSIDLYSMTENFWTKSMFERPKDRNVDCKASAFDMRNTDDYRIKICTEVDDNNFYIVHHEMGHIEYYMAYSKSQPYVYRDGANSAFHEAIGDTIGMFAICPTHGASLGLIDENIIDEKYEITYLMRTALQKVAFLPFAYVMDKYRFALFRNQIDRSKLNRAWWDMKLKYGGIMPPVERSEQNFDPGVKYHMLANVPYSRYFLSYILQFQFYRALCKIGQNEGPLHLCDIYQQKAVGDQFRRMLAMGNSRHWSEILEVFTGETTFRSEAILIYFQPLYKWLIKENIRRDYPVGW